MISQPLCAIKNCPKCNEKFISCAEGCLCGELPQIMPLDPGSECYCTECLLDGIVKKMNQMN